MVTELRHRTSVTFMMYSLNRVVSTGVSRSPPAKRRCSWRAPLPTIRSVRVDAVEHPGAKALDLAQAPPHVPSPLGLPLVQHVEEPVAGNGDVDLTALRCTAAGLVFNGRGGSTRRLDLGELLVCERPVDGFSWSPPGWALQADALRELVVVHDVVLQGSFPELLSAGLAAGRLRVPVWRPTQANRQGDGGPLGPHVVERLQLLL